MARSTAEARAIAREYKEHRGDDTMSRGAYVFAIALFIVAGIGISIVGANLMMQLPLNRWGIWAVLGLSIGWMVAVLVCGFIAIAAERWWVAALMYAIVFSIMLVSLHAY